MRLQVQNDKGRLPVSLRKENGKAAIGRYCCELSVQSTRGVRAGADSAAEGNYFSSDSSAAVFSAAVSSAGASVSAASSA